MATKTELQQALALKKENPNLSTRDAVMQVKQTESPTSATNQQVLAQNQAKVQSEIQAGTRPEAGFVGNAVQDLGGDVANRQNTRNVMTGQGGTRTPNGAILNADGTVTQTPESLASNAGSTIVGNQYDQRTPEQKAVGATATPEQAAKSTGGVIGGTPTTPIATTPTTPTTTTPETPNTPTQTTPPVPTDKNGIFNALVTGQAVTPTNTPEYRKAKASYDTFQKFNGMSKQQFIDSIKQGQITTELNSQLASNPVFQEAKAEIDKINRANGINTMITNISQGLSGNAIATPDYFETISANLIKKYGLTTNESQNAFKQIVSQDEDVVKATKELSEINRQVSETTQIINDGYKEIRQKYQGKLSATQLISYMDNRFRSATDTLNALNTQRQYVEADLKTATDMAINEYNAFQKDLADRNELRNTLLQSELGLANKQAELEMAKQYDKPTFQQYGDKVYQIVDGQLVDTGISTTSNQWQSANITRYNPSTGANESTPIFYRKKDTGAGFEAVDLAGNPIDANLLGGGTTGGTTGGGATGFPATFTGDTASYIASKEGFRENAYLDSAGVPTIGYGFTSVNGKPVKMGQTITKEQADAEFSKQIERHSTWKTLIDESTLSPSQKTALASFEYNLGPGIWNKSAMNIIDMIKSGDLQGAATEMKKYNQAGGKVVQGLVNRRNDEANLLLNKTKTSISQDNPLQVKEFENYDGKTIPAQYKTPMEQDDFVKRYNAWRNSASTPQIKAGDDLLKVNMGDKATEGEKTALRYGARMLDVVNKLRDSKVEEYFTNLPVSEQVLQDYVFPDIAKSDQMKEMNAYKLDFITAVLRRESGAAIGKDEYVRENKKYFPQPGDSQNVVLAKQNARNFAVKALLRDAGKDVNGNIISSLYNPEAFLPPNTDTKSRIADIRKKTNIK